jgi:Arc/MetJ-type ribon-helix-helix transcriptional regulator
VPRRSTALAKKSLVVDSALLGELMEVGGYRNESEAVRAAVASAVAIRRMQDAIAGLQARGTFGRRIK